MIRIPRRIAANRCRVMPTAKACVTAILFAFMLGSFPVSANAQKFVVAWSAFLLDSSSVPSAVAGSLVWTTVLFGGALAVAQPDAPIERILTREVHHRHRADRRRSRGHRQCAGTGGARGRAEGLRSDALDQPEGNRGVTAR